MAIGQGPDMPSRLELPVVPGVTAGAGLPPCPGLRGEPCHDYEPFENASAPLDLGTPDDGNSGSDDQSGNQGTAGSTTTGHAKRCKKSKKHRSAAAAKKRCKRKH